MIFTLLLGSSLRLIGLYLQYCGCYCNYANITKALFYDFQPTFKVAALLTIIGKSARDLTIFNTKDVAYRSR